MQQININELKSHPRNSEFFDDITGDSWNAFLESIESSGIIEPIVVTQDMFIVSGHQRVRAAKELGIETIMVDIRKYDEEDKVLKDLIETNIRQRGIGNPNPIKLGRCIKELERIYGIREGSAGNSHTNYFNGSSDLKTEKDLADRLGVTQQTIQNYKKLTELVPELQDWVETGILAPTTAIALIKYMSPSEQEDFVKSMDVTNRLTAKEVKSYIDQLREKDAAIVEKENTIDSLKAKIKESETNETLYKKRISELIQQGTKTEIITKEVDKPEILTKIKDLEEKLDKKNQENEKMSSALIEKEKMISQAIGSSTNYQLTSHCSEITLKMLNFIKEMAQYDYMAESFNEIPIATKMEYEKCIKSVKKWADRILETINEKKEIIEI